MTKKNEIAPIVCYCAVVAATVIFGLWSLNDVLTPLVKLIALAALLLAETLALIFVLREQRRFATFPNQWDLIVAKAEYLRVEYANADYGAQLEKIAETARYSDNVVSTNKDGAVLAALDALSKLLASSDAKAIENQINKLSALLEKRNIDARALKKGNF